MSKILYGAKIWAGAPKYILKTIQHLQLEVALVMIGPKSIRWSTTTLLKEMGWQSIAQLLQLASAKLTQRCLMTG